MTRHPVRTIVRCVICGARRRLDGRRIQLVEQTTRFVSGPHTTALVVDGSYVCWSHQTVEEYEATERRYGRTPWTR